MLENEFGLECDHGRLRLPGFISKIAEKTDAALQRLGIYHQKIHVLSEMNKHIACTVDGAKKELGYIPEYSIKQGMHISLSEMYN